MVIQRGGDLVHIPYQFHTADTADIADIANQHAQKAEWEWTVELPLARLEASSLP